MRNLLRAVALSSLLLPVTAFAASPSDLSNLNHRLNASTSLFPVLVQATAPTSAGEPGDGSDDGSGGYTPQAGSTTYQHAFLHFYTQMQMLAGHDQAEAFKKVWEHKYDNSGAFNSQDSASTAVEALAKAGGMLGCPDTFDGSCLYSRAFKAYMQFHHSPGEGPNLADPVERAKWAAIWEHKFDHTSYLLTPEGTFSAIRQMRDSLGQRFDYVFSPKQTKAESDEVTASFGGIGAPVEMHNMTQLKLNGTYQMLVHEPPPGSPSFGLLHYGDLIVSIDGQPVFGNTIETAFKKLVGKPGSHIVLVVNRKSAAGAMENVTVDVTRNYINDPHAPQFGDADIGTGVEITNRDNLKLGNGFELQIGAPFDGSPAAGKLKAGDLILAANGVSFTGMTVDEAVAHIRGPVGSLVTVTVERKGEKSPLEVTIVRGQIEQHAVHYKLLEDGISYIKLDQFEAQNIPADMTVALARAVLPLASKAIAQKGDRMSVNYAARFDALAHYLADGGKLSEADMPILLQAVQTYQDMGQGGGVILDLRDNPGGDLEILKVLGQMMLPKGTLLSMESRNPGTDEVDMHDETLTPTYEVIDDHPVGTDLGHSNVQETDRFPLLLPSNMPFVVLTSGGSASAAELLSGLIQANHRAPIIGKSTLGKGVGQNLIPLPYGVSLHVTNFEFFPGGMKSDYQGVIVDQDVDQDLTSKDDTQQNAAIAAIKTQQRQQADRAAAIATALTEHHAYFNKYIGNRARTDALPVVEQDPNALN